MTTDPTTPASGTRVVAHAFDTRYRAGWMSDPCRRGSDGCPGTGRRGLDGCLGTGHCRCICHALRATAEPTITVSDPAQARLDHLAMDRASWPPMVCPDCGESRVPYGGEDVCGEVNGCPGRHGDDDQDEETDTDEY